MEPPNFYATGDSGGMGLSQSPAGGSGIEFSGCSQAGSDLSGAEFAGAEFSGAEFARTEFADGQASVQFGEHLAIGRPRHVRESARHSIRKPARRLPVVPRPLRVVHVGMQIINAGIDNWLNGLVKYSDPSRLRFVRCIVTGNLIDREVIAKRGVPVVVGGRDVVRQAVDDCDILMMAGPPDLGEWLVDKPPRLGIFVAHSVCNWTEAFLNTCRPALDHVIAVSREVQDVICPGIPSTVIWNGVDPSHLIQTRSREEVRASVGSQAGDFVIGYVGRFSEEKRPEAVIEAVSRLPSRFRLLMVGWGNDGPVLEAAHRLLPGRFALIRAKDDLGDYYSAMDAFCFPSEFEGFGLVLLEAMLCSRPVIATPVGVVPEVIVDRVNGIVIDGTSDSIARAAKLLDQHPTWARAIAEEGRRHAEQHGLATRMARQYTELFERLWIEKFGDQGARGPGHQVTRKE